RRAQRCAGRLRRRAPASAVGAHRSAGQHHTRRERAVAHASGVEEEDGPPRSARARLGRSREGTMSKALGAASLAALVCLFGCAEDTHGTGPGASGGKPAADAGGAVARGGAGASSGGAGSGGRPFSDSGALGSGGTSGSGAGGVSGESGVRSGGAGGIVETPDAGRADADAGMVACGGGIDGIEVST